MVTPDQMKLDHPLLVQLKMKMPGTYKHSCRVAVLAMTAAVKLKLDPSLAFVAGLFHDIGKIMNGDSFIEATTEFLCPPSEKECFYS